MVIYYQISWKDIWCYITNNISACYCINTFNVLYNFNCLRFMRKYIWAENRITATCATQSSQISSTCLRMRRSTARTDRTNVTCVHKPLKHLNPYASINWFTRKVYQLFVDFAPKSLRIRVSWMFMRIYIPERKLIPAHNVIKALKLQQN